ncbi:uncharacterized protein K452DRAFT_285430 [Aplosporella prunicola CBS 121167]|uniref:Twinfilin n=1 Tax=Aplosporella prunicola CBS 121167 TaxID=1176127 RepID=A0A6A6BKK8_9PEZI|nr:uncharacterized protein K452DRAFT_285430 [Aplosporella prunicola CBS 121167]KAF2144188.1 hypothetical protein K452DRAFT_285430 [Aplosporella prunicola CBS 121167]
MQSGISASQELHTAFATLTSDSTQRALLATIKDEALVPSDTIAAQGDFLSDLSLLAPHLTPNAALYILLRLDSPGANNGVCAGITYVPDAAPVRQKMLFASTRLTLARELGGDQFAETFFATTAEELSAEGWKRHLAHVSDEAPLTQEELDLRNIKEAEALESHGTGARRVQTSGHLSMQVQEGVVEALKRLGEGGEENLVQLNIDVPTETIQLASSSTATASTLRSAIAPHEPRYSFYRHTTADAPLLFIYTCPPTSKVKERMVYAASRGFAVHLAEHEAQLAIAKRLEFSSPEDIDEGAVDEEFAPREEKKAGFSKPKRPGRR